MRAIMMMKLMKLEVQNQEKVLLNHNLSNPALLKKIQQINSKNFLIIMLSIAIIVSIILGLKISNYKMSNIFTIKTQA